MAAGAGCAAARVAATSAGNEISSSRLEIDITSPVDDEFEQVAVRIARVDARAIDLASALARDRSFFHARVRALEPRLELRGGAVPHETQIATRRRRPWGAQRERAVLPARW